MDSPSSNAVDTATLHPVRTRWVVSDAILEMAHDWQVSHNQPLTLAMPAEEQEWRDNQHYRAYVRDIPPYLYDICPEEL